MKTAVDRTPSRDQGRVGLDFVRAAQEPPVGRYLTADNQVAMVFCPCFAANC